MYSLNAMASNPTTDTSSGTRRPASLSARMSPNAISSLAQNTAVIPRSSAIRRPTEYPDAGVQSPCQTGGTLIPAASSVRSQAPRRNDDEGNPTIVGNEALIESIETYKQLVDSGVFVEVNSWDEYIGTFVNSNVAGTINGVWILGSIQSAPDQSGLWGITNLPKLDGVDGATHYSANGGSSWAISSNGDKELAADFLNATFAGSNEFYDTILPASGALANWLPAGESDVYGEPQDFFGGEPVFSQALEFAAEVPSNNTGVYYYEGRDAVSAAVTKILGGTDVETALQEAQDNVEFAMQ